MLANRVRKSTSGKPRRTVATAIAAASLITFSLVSAPPASAATARNTGWHDVCANSLTQYNNGYVQTLDWGDGFDIDHFAGDNHVWGWGYHNLYGRQWGWVTNGWFC